MICYSCNQSNRSNARFCSRCGSPLLLKDNYRVTRLLGRGGFAAVYQAERVHLSNAPCAVKELLPDPNVTPQQEEQAAEQFHLEASVLAHLDFRALPKVGDFFNERGKYYLVMDYVDGQTLQDILAQAGKPLPEADVLAWADELLQALAYLHNRKPTPVIHRDIKPSNIKITTNGQVKLIDFGISKLMASKKGTGSPARAVSPPYSPMEQYGMGTDERSDIYALGVTLYQLLTNQLPPEAPDRATQPVIPPREHNPSLSSATEEMLLKAMAEKPSNRYPSAHEMLKALQLTRRIQEPESKTPVGDPAGKTRRRSRLVAMLAIGGIIGVILTASAAFIFLPNILPHSTPAAPAIATQVAVSSPVPRANPSSTVPAASLPQATPVAFSPTPARVAAQFTVIPIARFQVIRDTIQDVFVLLDAGGLSEAERLMNTKVEQWFTDNPRPNQFKAGELYDEAKWATDQSLRFIRDKQAVQAKKFLAEIVLQDLGKIPDWQSSPITATPPSTPTFTPAPAQATAAAIASITQGAQDRFNQAKQGALDALNQSINGTQIEAVKTLREKVIPWFSSVQLPTDPAKLAEFNKARSATDQAVRLIEQQRPGDGQTQLWTIVIPFFTNYK